MIEVKRINDIFDLSKAHVVQLPYEKDSSIRLYLDKTVMKHDNMRVIVNGKKKDNLDETLKDKSQIILMPDIKAFIGTAVVATFAFLAAHAVTIGTIAIMAAVTAFTLWRRPSVPSFGTASTRSGTSLDESSPTYGWEGVQTIQEVGMPVPVVYGEHRVGGNKINEYIWTDGDKNYLNVLLSLCEGEIEAISDIKINDNPIANFDGIDQYTRPGTNIQSVIPNFEDLHNLYSVNIQLTKDNPYLYTTNDADVEAFEIHLQLPSGLYQQNSSNGSVQSWSVTYKVEYKLHTEETWIDLGETTINEKKRTAVRRVFRKEGLAPGQYDIRITRISDDSDFYKMGDLYLQQIDEIKTDDLKYPNTALLGLKLLATEQLSGASPNITCVVKGKKIMAPQVKNGETEVPWEDYYWDNVTEKYRLLSDDTELSWDGETYVQVYCANPIWCLRDLFISPRYGLGEYIDSSIMDDNLLVAMSRYCEEKVSDGKGGYEKRFRLDVVIDSPTRALELVSQLCVSFRCLPFYSEGAIKLKIDKDDTPVQVFSMGNIIEDSFTEHWKSIRETPNIIEVQFLDKDKDYKQETVAVIDEASLASGDIMRKKQVRIFTTRMSQAIREGRYILYYSKYITRSVGFKAGIDAVAIQPGDVVSLSHDVPQWGFSGRIMAGSTTTLIKLDRKVTILGGKTYKVRIRFAEDDSIEEKTVLDGPGDYMELNVDSPFSKTPQAYDIYVFGEENILVKPFRVMSMQKEGTNEVNIVALEYDTNVYDDSAITLPTSNYSALSRDVPNVNNLELTERLIKRPDGTIENAIDVWFDRPTPEDYEVRQFAKAKIYISDDNIHWNMRGETTGIHFPITGDIVDGITYYVKLVTVTNDGAEGSFDNSPVDQISIVGKSAVPSDVIAFLVNQNRDRMYFGWTEITDVDVWGYEIRWGSDWDSGLVIAFVQGSRYLTTNFRKGSSQSYWIKAVDTSGNYSQNPKEATVTVDNIPFRNIITEYSEQPSWSGTKDNTEKIGDNLKISDGQTQGTYTTPVRDVGYVATFYIGIEVIVSINQGLAFNDDPSLKFNDDPSLRFTGTEIPGAATFEIRTSEDNINWSEYQEYQAGDYKCRYFQIKMTLKRSSPGINLLCSTFDYYSDLPDVDEYGANTVSVADDGKAVIFEKTYHEEPVVNISILSGDGIYYQFIAKDMTGFTVKLFDASGVAKTGQFEYHAHGV